MSAALILPLGACSTSWKVDYDQPVPAEVSRGWTVVDVVAVAPERLTVSESNFFAPNADIVWHGDEFGDRRAQVAAIVDEGISQGASELKGPRGVTITARIETFHGVTPSAVARAPSAVHNIEYVVQVLDANTGQALTEPQRINADLEANVGAAAIAAAINGQTQKRRITDHIARVTRGWLGFGPDQRRTFAGLGR